MAPRANPKAAAAPAPAAAAKASSSSSSSASDTLLLPAAVASASFLLQYLATNGIIPTPATPSPAKPFADFDSFYTSRYLPEHSQPGTKILHLIGTLSLILLASKTPSLLFALGAGLAAGHAVFPLFRGIDSGLPEMAVMLGIYLVVGTRLTGSFRTAFTVPLVAYGCAWLGHFIVEHNKPATFIYPSFSLMGDFRMVWSMITKMTTEVQ
jgi:hypothetical protein